MMYKKKSHIALIVLFALFHVILSPIINGTIAEKIGNYTISTTSFEKLYPGEIIEISFSNTYPTIGEPIDIIVTVQGNPTGENFNETLTISDDFQGLITKNSEAEWKSGQITLDKVELTIGRLPRYIKKIDWYPVIAGNHSLTFKAGNFSEKIKNISVSFDTEYIIFPSIGCPSIINKDKTEQLVLVISEERQNSDDILNIDEVKLINIDDVSTYILDDQIILFNIWISISEKEVEDEFIVSYNISSIPCGFYNITVATTKNEYTWPHAVKIINEESETYSFVQLTDPHIGKTYNLLHEEEILTKIIFYINEEINPDFVIMSGDLVDWYNGRIDRNFFLELQDVLATCNSPVYTVPGNHDRYEHRLLFLYYPFYDLSNYHRYINPLNDYAFDYGNMNFLLLDSGYDYSRWEIKLNFWNPTPEGSGLTNTQIYLIENELGNNKYNQNVIMHHPAVTQRDDYGLFPLPDTLPSGNEACIAFNRARFIEYCLLNNISLVLSGHTHENKILNFLGEESTDLHAWPLFVQTHSTTLYRRNEGGRLIHINEGQVVNYEYMPFL